MSLRLCTACNHHYVASESSCPHCSKKSFRPVQKASWAVLLGLSLTACGETEKDTATDDTSTSVVEPEMSALYGVPNVDNDGDGYEMDVDCNDDDPDIHPDAEEIPGDGIDSNCNNDDDT